MIDKNLRLAMDEVIEETPKVISAARAITPRTDAELLAWTRGERQAVQVTADFARTLECELAAAKAITPNHDVAVGILIPVEDEARIGLKGREPEDQFCRLANAFVLRGENILAMNARLRRWQRAHAEVSEQLAAANERADKATFAAAEHYAEGNRLALMLAESNAERDRARDALAAGGAA